jgi:hypothetical protein
MRDLLSNAPWTIQPPLGLARAPVAASQANLLNLALVDGHGYLVSAASNFSTVYSLLARPKQSCSWQRPRR